MAFNKGHGKGRKGSGVYCHKEKDQGGIYNGGKVKEGIIFYCKVGYGKGECKEGDCIAYYNGSYEVSKVYLVVFDWRGVEVFLSMGNVVVD